MQSHSVAVSESPLVGTLVDGRYRVMSELGSGAVGTVFQAVDERTQAGVALKVWRGCDDAQTRGRFEREAKALQTLQHPNIVAVHGLGFVGGSPYVAMELLEGQTLETALHDGHPLAPERAISIARQVLAALAFAHARSVVHRDLKPDNIFLARDRSAQPHGEAAKLLDYGLAKFLGAEDDPTRGVNLTVTGMMMGTPLYMPPEQAAGSPIDVRADVYAMGCILFEMLTGRLPYLGDDIGSLIRAHVSAPIPRLADALPGASVAPALQRLIETAMAKQASDRYADAGQMLAALDALPQPAITREPVDFRPSAVTDLSLPAQRDGNRTVLYAVAAGVALVGAALAWVVLG